MLSTVRVAAMALRAHHVLASDAMAAVEQGAFDAALDSDGARCAFEGPEDLFGWVRENGGFIDRRLELSTGPDPSNQLRGIFASARIASDEVLAEIPWHLLITDTDCDGVARLRSELAKGRCSQFWPYLRELRDHTVDIPNAWPTEVLGLVSALPPHDWTRHSRWYSSACGGDMSDPASARALLLYVARSDQFGMSPVFDSINHRAGTWTSIGTSWHPPDSMVIKAIRDIDASEQLYNNYHNDEAAQYLRDYGFVAPTPRTWRVVAGGRDLTFSELDDASVHLGFKATGHLLASFVTAASAMLAQLQTNTTFEPSCGGGAPGRPAKRSEVAARQHALATSYRSAYANALSKAIAGAESRARGMEL